MGEGHSFVEEGFGWEGGRGGWGAWVLQDDPLRVPELEPRAAVRDEILGMGPRDSDMPSRRGGWPGTGGGFCLGARRGGLLWSYFASMALLPFPSGRQRGEMHYDSAVSPHPTSGATWSLKTSRCSKARSGVRSHPLWR